MEELIPFTMLNDFIFCPASIYFHGMYDDVMNLLYTGVKQLRGKAEHKKIDNNEWTKSCVLCSIAVNSHKYGLTGKIDKYYPISNELVETKTYIKNIYDGYIFQLYAQYFAMIESGYKVDKLTLYSKIDNKKYKVKLPVDDKNMFFKFKQTINELKNFKLSNFKPTNSDKCNNCIYINACTWGGFFD